jgi:hypothetical protein
MEKNIYIKKFKGFQNSGFSTIPIIIEMYSDGHGILKIEGCIDFPYFLLELNIKSICREETNYSFWRNHLEYYTMFDAKFYIIEEIELLNKNSEIEKFLNQYLNYFGKYEVVYSEEKGILFGYYNYKDTTLLLTQTNQRYFDCFSLN